MGVEPAMGQVQGFHQGLQAGGADAVAAKAHRRFFNDALMGLSFVILRVAHERALCNIAPY